VPGHVPAQVSGWSSRAVPPGLRRQVVDEVNPDQCAWFFDFENVSL
jgi:hypothetical protein